MGDSSGTAGEGGAGTSPFPVRAVLLGLVVSAGLLVLWWAAGAEVAGCVFAPSAPTWSGAASSLWCHVSFRHVLSNAAVLALCVAAAPRLAVSWRLLAVTAAGAHFSGLLFSMLAGSRPLAGASAAVAGVAALLLVRRRRPLEMALFAFWLLSGLVAGSAAVAHVAHAGGGVFGAVTGLVRRRGPRRAGDLATSRQRPAGNVPQR